MKAQTVFDKVVRHLHKQGKRAFQDNAVGGACLYRTKEGLTCAVGCLIPEEAYHSSMEGKNVTAILDFMPKYFEHVDLLEELQNVHDSSKSRSWLVRELRSVAVQFGLATTQLDNKMTDEWQDAGEWG